VLQEQEFEPLGSNTVKRIDVRVIAATSRNLSEMVAAGSFRPDLYYRLAVLPLRVPALRERRDDIELLVEALSEDIARRSGMPLRTLGADAIALLQQQPWPGNIRELRNVLEQASMMSDELHLGARHFAGLLPQAASSEPIAETAAPPSTESILRPLSEQIREVERRAIAAALVQTGGNKVATAKLLRISRAALYEKLALYGL
jgi:DNA-binding NtrC family response regulator